MSSRVFLLVSLTFACWLSTASCLSVQRRDTASVAERPEGWRRAKSGWEDASRWPLDTNLRPLSAPTATVHPFVIASLELLISVGALVMGSPSARVTRR